MTKFNSWLMSSALLSLSLSSPAWAEQRAGLWGVAGYNDACGSRDDHSPALAGALLGAVILPVVKAGVNGLGSALAKAGAKDEAKLDVQAAGMFFNVRGTANDRAVELQRTHSCLAVAVGSGSGEGIPSSSPEAGRLLGQELSSFLGTRGFAHLPSFLMAGAVALSPDRSAWRFVPEFLHVGRPLSSGGWAKGAGRDLVVTVTLTGVGAKEDDAVIASRSIKIDRRLLASNPEPKSEALAALGTSWMPLPPPNDATRTLLSAAAKRRDDRAALSDSVKAAKLEAATASGSIRSAALKKVEAAEKELKALQDLIEADHVKLSSVVPFTVRFSIQETRDGNKFVANVGKALSENADAISKPIADQIYSPGHVDNAVAAGEAEDKLRVAAITAVLAWQTSVAGGEDASKQRVALVAAEGACRTLKLRGFVDVSCLDLPK